MTHTQTAEEFLESVGDISDDSINEVFDKLDIMDDTTRERHNIDDLDDSLDYDEEEEYYNEQQASGLHPQYGAFDDPDVEDEDEDYLWIE